MEVGGEIETFEGRKACAPLNKHVLGWRMYFQWYVIAAILVVGLPVDIVVERFAPGWGVVGAMIVALIGMIFLLRWAPRMAQDAWRLRGVPPSMNLSYRVEEQDLVIIAPSTETKLAWWSVSEIIPGRDCWLFVGTGVSYFLPRRFFATPSVEAAFLRICLERMSPEARARSPKAAALAA